VEESAAASESLKEQALRLAQSVAVFKVKQMHEAITLTAPAKTPAIGVQQPMRPLAAPAKAATARTVKRAAQPAPAGQPAVEDDWKEL